MTFTEIVADIMDRLNLTSTDAQTRIGSAVNRKYKQVTSSLGLVLSRRTTVQKAATPGVQAITFTGIEKTIAIIDKSSGTNRILDEITYEQMLAKAPTSGDTAYCYAIETVAANTVTILFDCIFQTAFVMYAEGHATAGTLSGSQEPAFSESYHDILSEAVLIDEYRKKEDAEFLKASKSLYEQRMGELRLWLATSAYLDFVQGGNKRSQVLGSVGGSGGGSSINGATSYTQTGLITFDRDPSAPFAVTASSAVVPNLKVNESEVQFTDITTGDVTSTKHGYAPKSPADATKFLNGAATPAYALVKDSDLATTDVTTNNVTTAKHGFITKAPNDTTKRYIGDASWASNIAFAAVQVASADANTLDDYEEGVWTPVIGGSGGTSGQSYTSQVGHYVKIGKLVHATFNVLLSNKGTITTDVQIQGLPFTIENISNYAPPLTISFWSTLAVAWAFLGGFGGLNTTACTVYGTKVAAINHTVLSTTDIANTTQLLGSITYRASA